MSNLQEFEALGLSEVMLGAVEAKGFETPSPIQKLTIPVLLGRTNDIIAQAQTGTGKTAAFGLPVLDRLTPSREGVQALVLVPTRELALQVTEELLSFNRKKLSIAAIYGGASMSEQLRRLAKGIDIVVGTPGRILDHIRRGTLRLEHTRYLVLDEADEMLNMGFIEDIEEIMSHVDEKRRVLLFSATMPERIVQLSKKYMHDTEILKVESAQLTTELTDQIYFEVRESDKFDALTRIIDVEPDFYGIVFSRTKVGVDELVNRLLERGYAAEGLHGDVSQAQREKILRKFKKRQANILVATDVAARGIDINNLTHVINYSLPQDSESYVHRIGRTGRAGNQGTAITFISSSELRQFGYLKRDLKADIKRETLPSPQDVVAMKRAKVLEELKEVIDSENYTEYTCMARDILGQNPPEVALSALLRLAFKNQLEESHYPEIRSINVDRRGTARLFISIGRKDGYDARKMVALLKRECGLNDSKIDDVKVMDNYSFVSVPFADAESVVRRLNALRKGERPVAELAADGKGGGKGLRSHAEKGEGRRRRPAGERPDAGEPEIRRERKERERPDTGERKKYGAGRPKPAERRDAEEEKVFFEPVPNNEFDWAAFERAAAGEGWDRASRKGTRSTSGGAVRGRGAVKKAATKKRGRG